MTITTSYVIFKHLVCLTFTIRTNIAINEIEFDFTNNIKHK